MRAEGAAEAAGKERRTMIPCKSGCAEYCEGCHKTCARWRAIQAENRARRCAVKEYLNRCDRVSSTVIRQCLRISGIPYRTV